MTVVALPKGRLSAESHRLLQELGIDTGSSRRYRYVCTNPFLDVRLLKLRDIAHLVGTGVATLGICGDEWVAESGASVTPIQSLDWYRARVSLISAPDTPRRWLSSTPLKVATEYPNITAAYFKAQGRDVQLVPVSGSAEALVPGLADCAVDCVETGETLLANGLSERSVLLRCGVSLVANTEQYRSGNLDDAIEAILGAIDGAGLRDTGREEVA